MRSSPMLRYLSLFFETLAVWLFFVNIQYSEACIALGCYTILACCAEAHRARGGLPSPYLNDRVVLLASTIAYPLVFLMYLPSKVAWFTTVLLVCLALLSLAWGILRHVGEDPLSCEVCARIFLSAATVAYCSAIEPSPDEQMEPVYYSYIRALAIFQILGSALAFVLSLSIGWSRARAGNYGVVESQEIREPIINAPVPSLNTGREEN